MLSSLRIRARFIVFTFVAVTMNELSFDGIELLECMAYKERRKKKVKVLFDFITVS